MNRLLAIVHIRISRAWKWAPPLFIWFWYNVVLGAAFLWLSWLFLFLAGDFAQDWDVSIRNGSLAVFVLTLCASQAGLFVEVTGVRFQKINAFLLGVFILVIMAAAFLSAIVSTGTVPTLRPDSVVVMSLILLFLAVVSCATLYRNRLLDGDEQYAANQRQRTEELAAEARANVSVDGMKI